MAQFNELSKREQEVVQHLLEGKSNKLIALSLGVSDRTVEFHLKNIYAKFQVSTRVELILKLGQSTVAGSGEVAENKDRLNVWNWAASLRDAVSKISEELIMKSKVNSNVPNEAGTLTFFESIRECLIKYAEFNGRASRSEFWWFMLFIILVAAALQLINETVSNIFLVAILLPLLAAGTRRLRDSGKSPWWQWFLLAPVGGIVLLGFLWAMPPVNPTLEDTFPA
jgi:DNA-binding CsgD family transcriptional regulator